MSTHTGTQVAAQMWGEVGGVDRHGVRGGEGQGAMTVVLHGAVVQQLSVLA